MGRGLYVGRLVRHRLQGGRCLAEEHVPPERDRARLLCLARRGRIWAEAGSGDGATFSFTLPLGTPPAIDAADGLPGVTQAAQP